MGARETIVKAQENGGGPVSFLPQKAGTSALPTGGRLRGLGMPVLSSAGRGTAVLLWSRKDQGRLRKWGSLSRKYRALYKPYFQINARMPLLALIPSRTGLSKHAYSPPVRSLSHLCRPPTGGPHSPMLKPQLHETSRRGSRAAALGPQPPAPR